MTLDQVFGSIDLKWRMEQWPQEIYPFAKFLREQWPTISSKIVVELGVRHGGTSALWHQLLPDAKVFGIDRVGHDSYQEPEFSARGREMEAEFPRFTFLKGDTGDPHTLGRLVERIDSQPIGFLFVDADHSYPGVSRDYELFGSLVAPGGLVAFHDIVDSPRTGGGVAKFWTQVEGRVAEFKCGGDWGGIGVVRK